MSYIYGLQGWRYIIDVFSARVTTILRTSAGTTTLRTSARRSYCQTLHSNGSIMTSQEPTRVVLEDALANSSEMELTKPSAIPLQQSRLYQREMFEASMAHNIIVVVVLLHAQLILLF